MILSLSLVLFTLAGAECDGICGESGQVHTQLVQIRDESAPTLIPVGRTFLTTDAQLASSFFQDFFGAKEITQNVTFTEGCAQSRSVEWAAGIVFTFSEYADSHAALYIDAVQQQWDAVYRGDMSYSRWIDNHDGFNIRDEHFFNRDAFLGAEFYVQMSSAYARVQVPQTMWAIELSGNNSALASPFIDPFRMIRPAPSDLLCRVSLSGGNVMDESPFSTQFWWKSTFATEDPNAAADFVKQYLLGTETTSEYPDTYGNCTLSKWIVLPNSVFQVHFAHTAPADEIEPSVTEWAQHVEDIRKLDEGKFDQHMMNNLVLWTESLDPFVQLFQSGQQPFIAVRLAQDIFDVFVSVPKNQMVFRLRSHHLTVAEPLESYDSCA